MTPIRPGFTPDPPPPNFAEEVARTEALIVNMLAADTGCDRAQLLADLRAGRAFSALSAQAYGLIDRVASKLREP
jgi:ATP-dependent protease ClpP protease subunit